MHNCHVINCLSCLKYVIIITKEFEMIGEILAKINIRLFRLLMQCHAIVKVIVIVAYLIVTLYSSELLYISGCEDLSSGVEQSTASVWTNTQPFKRYNDYSRGTITIQYTYSSKLNIKEFMTTVNTLLKIIKILWS